MRASEEEATGSSALSYVKGDFEAIHWGPIENPTHDLGTDLLIQVRDERRFALGLILGAQVKGGPSFFEEPQQADDGSIEGWWYYESTAAHFDDWVRSGLPHLLVLYNFETKESHWVHVTRDRCVRSPKGCKILVPREQTVDAQHIDALLDVALAQRAAGGFEQKAFLASASNAPPGQRLRYALLTPKLIAPHGNSGYDRSLEPEEYLAILLRQRASQLRGFKDKHPEHLNTERIKSCADRRWRFAHAVEVWLDTGNADMLQGLQGSAHDASQRTALAAARVVALLARTEHAAALTLLDELIKKDEATPVDFGWLVVHRATVRRELGDISGAREDAAAAMRSLRGDDEDPTASLLAGVAAHILFVTAGFGSGDLQGVINSNDTAPAWWRAQTLSWALGHLDDEIVDEWISDDRLHFTSSTQGWDELQAARLNAALASDHDAWRAIVSRQARYVARRAEPRRDEKTLAWGLDQLRRAGAETDLARIATLVLRAGPIRALIAVAQEVAPSTMTRSTIAATLKLWAVCADVLPQAFASELLKWCTGVLADPAALRNFRNQFAITFGFEKAVLDAIKALLPVAPAEDRAAAARLVLALSPKSLLAQDWAGIVLSLDDDTFRALGRDAVRAKAIEVEDFLLKDAFLRRLAVDGDADACEQLEKRAETDVYAMAYVPGQSSLGEPFVRRSLRLLADRMFAVRETAARNSFDILGFDHAELMAQFNLLHPSAADWDSLFAFLADPAVAHEDKEGAVWRFIAHFDTLDDELRARVRGIMSALLSTNFRHGMVRKEQPHATVYLHIMFIESEAEQESAIAALLSGDASQRRLAARLLGHGIAPKFAPSLNALLADESRAVRSAAAFGVGRVVARDDSNVTKWAPALARIIADTGTSVPASFINGVSDDAFAGDAGVLDTLEIFRLHPSAHVRAVAESAFAKLRTAQAA